MFALILIASTVVSQPPPASAGLFSPTELRTMCRGETDDQVQFRTDAAFRLYADFQRSKCRMYLLGLADGMAGASVVGGDPVCLPPSLDREVLADRLVALLLADAEADSDLSPIIERVLRAESRCP